MITRWNPFREMRTMNRMLEDAIEYRPLSWENRWSLALDVAESEDGYIVKASLPGIKADDLEITFSENVLTIKGEIEEDKELDEAHYHMRERRFGSFSRSIRLPSGIESEEIEASFEDGVLKLHLPKADEVKPKKIAISSSSPKVIDAESISKN